MTVKAKGKKNSLGSEIKNCWSVVSKYMIKGKWHKIAFIKSGLSATIIVDDKEVNNIEDFAVFDKALTLEECKFINNYIASNLHTGRKKK